MRQSLDSVKFSLLAKSIKNHRRETKRSFNFLRFEEINDQVEK